MIVAVLDTSAVAAGVGWSGGAARHTLILLARRTWQSARSADLTAEWVETVKDLARNEPRWRNANWPQWIDWLKQKSALVNGAELRTTVKRDRDDDVVLAAARGARARYLISYDRDLLSLGKPFGIEIIRPEAFISLLLRS